MLCRNYHTNSPKRNDKKTLEKKDRNVFMAGNLCLFLKENYLIILLLLYLIAVFYLKDKPGIMQYNLIMYMQDSTGDNSSDAIRDNIGYFQDQAKLYLDAKNTLNIPESEWTDAQRDVVKALKQMNEYNEDAIREGYMDNIKAVQDNIKKLSPDSVAESSTTGKRATGSNSDFSNKGRRV